MFVGLLVATLPLWVSAQTIVTDFCWVPSPATDLAGHRLYACTASPCTKAAGSLLLDVPLAGTHTRADSPGLVCVAIPNNKTGFATVTAYDLAGNESIEDGTVFFDKIPPGPDSGLVVK